MAVPGVRSVAGNPASTCSGAFRLTLDLPWTGHVVDVRPGGPKEGAVNRSIALTLALPLTAAALVASGLAALPTPAAAAPTLIVNVRDNNGPLVGASPVVTLYEKNGDQFTKAASMASANASFVVDNAKTYVLGFQDQNGAYLSEYYNDAATQNLADVVVPGAGTVTWGVAKAGRATGRIQNVQGDSISDPAPVINVYRASDCALLASPAPKAAADNLLVSMPTGSYKLQVTWESDPAVYETVWYGGADTNASSCAGATTLSLIAGTTLTDVDITVPGIPPNRSHLAGRTSPKHRPPCSSPSRPRSHFRKHSKVAGASRTDPGRGGRTCHASPSAQSVGTTVGASPTSSPGHP